MNKSTPKILEILAVPVQYGGIEMFIKQFLESLDFEIEVDCLTPYNCTNKDLIEQLKRHNGSFYELNLPMTVNKNILYRPICDFFSTHTYDIVHIHSSEIWTMSLIAAAADKKINTTVIVHSHATGSKSSLAMRIFRNLASLSMRKHVDRYCSCSLEAAKWKYTKKYLNQTIIIRNGIKTERFLFNQDKRTAIRQSLGISESEFVIGNVGRLRAVKNQEFVIHIFAEILNKKPNSWLMLVGDGPDREALELLAQKIKVSNRVIFIGNTSNVEDYLFAMDIFLFPSKHEAFGLAVLEAQASGLPVISSDQVPDDVKISRSIQFLPLNDNADVWASAAINITGDKRENGVERVKEAGYDIQFTINQMKQLYLNTTS